MADEPAAANELTVTATTPLPAAEPALTDIEPRIPAVGAAAVEPPPCSPSGVPFQVMDAPLVRTVEEESPPMPWTNNPHLWDTRYFQPQPRNEERIVHPAAASIGPEADSREIERALKASGWTPPQGLKIK